MDRRRHKVIVMIRIKIRLVVVKGLVSRKMKLLLFIRWRRDKIRLLLMSRRLVKRVRSLLFLLTFLVNFIRRYVWRRKCRVLRLFPFVKAGRILLFGI